MHRSRMSTFSSARFDTAIEMGYPIFNINHAIKQWNSCKVISFFAKSPEENQNCTYNFQSR